MSSNASRTVAALTAPSGTAAGHDETEAQRKPRDPGATLTAPVAQVVRRVELVHGQLREDDYFWLRDRGDPAVVAYLEAENRYTASVMRHTEALQERLYQ